MLPSAHRKPERRDSDGAADGEGRRGGRAPPEGHGGGGGLGGVYVRFSYCTSGA